MKTGAWWVFVRLACIGLLLGGAGSAAAQVAASPWPLFHADAQRTGRTTVVGPAAATNVRIAYRGPQAFRSSPAIGPDGTVYAGSGRSLCAIDPMTDNVKWCNDTTANVVFASPALGVDPGNPTKILIYQGARDNRLHAIDQDGNTRWAYKVGIDGDVATSAVMNAAGAVFFGGSQRMHSMNPAGTGSVNWVEGLDGTIFMANPALSPAGDVVYVGTISGSLYAYSPGGTLNWRITVGRNIRFSAPAVGADGTIYVGTREGLVSVTDNGMSATINWTYPMSGRGVVSTPAIGADGTIYVGGQGGAAGGGAAFYAIKPDMTLVWSYATGKFFRGSPVIDGAGRIYATTGKDLICFDSTNASNPFLWNFNTARNIYASPVLDGDGTLWVASGDRNLYAIWD